MNELYLRRQITLHHHFEALNFCRTILLVSPLVISSVATAVAFRLAYPRGFRLKGIQIKVEWKMIERLSGQVVIGKQLGCVDCMLGGIVARIHLVMHDPLR